MELQSIIEEVYKITEESMAVLRTKVLEVAFPKGHILLKSGKIESDIFFIKTGLVRAYSDTDSRDVTFWFGKEGDIVLSMRSYVDNQKGYENIECLENSKFYKISTTYLRDLFITDINLANFGRRLVERELIKTEERLIAMQFKTAQERYEELINTNPDLLQRVQLGHIASYLGITQVSLSRIRASFR